MIAEEYYPTLRTVADFKHYAKYLNIDAEIEAGRVNPYFIHIIVYGSGRQLLRSSYYFNCYKTKGITLHIEQASILERIGRKLHHIWNGRWK